MMSSPFRAARSLVGLCTVILWASPAWAQRSGPTAVPPSIVIVPFETNRTGWMPPPHFGETVAELLTARLASEGVRVIDRQWLPDAPADLRGAAVARLAEQGVDYVVFGSVTRLSIERRSSSGLGVLPVPIAAGLVRRQKTETALALAVRVVDVRTGAILESTTTEGVGEHQNTSGGGLALVGKLPVIGGRRTSATGIQDGLIDRALVQAVDAAAQAIAGSMIGEVDQQGRASGAAAPSIGN